MATTARLARAMHGVIEPLHAITYFAPETRQAWQDLGLEPVAQGYVAGRAAPLGTVGPGVVAACFFNFNPTLLATALPDAWEVVTPAQVLATRAEAMQACLQRLLDEGATAVTSQDVQAATDLARDAVGTVSFGGRPLAAGNAEVVPSGLPLADLWQAVTTLREYRGDAHVALLTTSGLSPVEAIVLYAGWQDTVSRRFLQVTRMWDDTAWEAGVEGLRRRGLVDDQGLTNAGIAYREDIEDRTDAASATPWEHLGEDATRRLHRLLHPLAVAVAAGYPRPPTIPDALEA